MANTKLKIIKILEILKETDEETPMTSAKIRERLKDCGIEAERKSICRDINVLMDDDEYDIILCSDKKQGYFMGEHALEDWEAKVLIDSVWSSKFLTRQNAEALAEKIENMVSQNSRKMLNAITPVKSRIKSMNPTTKINIEKILSAVKRNKKIAFKYTYTDTELGTQFKRDGFVYRVSPYALLQENENYYLIGNYDGREGVTYYRVDRMRGVIICDEIRKDVRAVLGENADLLMDEYVRNTIYHYGGNKIRVTLEIKEEMVDNIIEQFGMELQFRPSENGLYHVSINAMDSDGLYYWLMQYGKNAKVIGPEKVKDKLVRCVEDVLKQYK